MRSFVSFALIAVFGVLASPATHAQRIQGKVLDAGTGQPVPDASVILLDTKGEIQRGTLTDANGFYELLVPNPGRYTLRIGAAGYDTRDLLPVESRAGETVEMEDTAIRMSYKSRAAGELTERKPEAASDGLGFVGVYEWEVPIAGLRGTVTLHSRSGTTTRDTLTTSDGRVIECGGLREITRARSQRCGDFTIKVIGDHLEGTFRQCQTRMVAVTRYVRDMTTGEIRAETFREPKTVCEDVLMLLKKQGGAP